MVMTVSMIAGVAGAVVLALAGGKASRPVRAAHLVMVVVMVGMVIVEMAVWWSVLSAAVLALTAMSVTREGQDRWGGIACAVDLTAMAALLLMVPAPPREVSGLPHSNHGRGHGLGLEPRLAAAVILVGWLIFTLRHERTAGPSGKVATGGALAMIVGMIPMAL
ncbi:hypothetical protein HQ346_14250 [Rhodococcus sp. BP-252]|uniref:hypothetical protein n=1 Tax=unclassified Rhodococcus (in: high G+C Gram-positive bacteria) TaxID=192944 RepID=UPI001C9A3D0B|nr:MULTISPECIES: hypothetical protein [unclassified Rhodococcus (in: high G+C Gram-positive bacteria)]MBY6412845.1 hypothetical protein [Rhodococcus sp. BP-320]MBY6417618.1 hypothetical protein [Rhodococcus sp. BP-321]MBY6423470.1 hypothetical protein [Rhodococcus sp. BP-324]MBY6427642.1 hypothetical protein [Rhodococcus sp. BP-323]MBY6432806.1 hypothetical protein [Rhodococcus sp. BP-322]